MLRKTRFGRSILVVGALFALSACGGGGGSGSGAAGSVAGLETPSTMSVVTSQSQGASATFSGVKASQAAASVLASPLPGAGTDYANDKQNVYVFDESMESLQTVNMILCLMGQTRASDMVNQGAYIALVDENKCEQGQNQSSAGASGQSSARSVQYNKWTILSERASNNAPQHVKIWVPPMGGEEDHAEHILVEVTVNEGVSTSKPFGDFALNFKGIAADGPMVGSEIMKGSLKTVARNDDKLQFQFINVGGSEAGIVGAPFGFAEAANVILDDAAGATGVGKTYRAFNEPGYSGEASFGLAYNADYALRSRLSSGLTDNACLSRDPDTFTTQVWRYNLYDSTTGARKSLNSGFPFVYNDQQGHVGYWGMWYEDAANPVPDGATIAKRDHATAANTDYIVNIAPGKLIRRNANTATVTSLRDMDLYFWGQVGAQNGQFRATVNASNLFVATDSVSWESNGPTLTPLAAPVDITPSSGQTLFLWSDALGGNVVFVGGSANVTYFAEEFVRANDSALSGGPVTLYCYDRCVKGGLTQSDITAAASDPDLLYHSNAGAPYLYSAEVDNGKVIVKDHTGAAVSAAALDLSSLAYNDWGINTGEMVTAAVSNPWEVYDAPTSYRWETGPNQWNQMVTVRNAVSSQLESFDKPVQFNYTFDAADNRNPSSTTYVGKTLMLQYGGPGQLWGFPWTQVPGSDRWHSGVTLNDGVLLSDSEGSYVVKAIELEQSMTTVATATCSSAGLDTGVAMALNLPSVADIGAVSITLAGKPTVTSSPAVIDGELQ